MSRLSPLRLTHVTSAYWITTRLFSHGNVRRQFCQRRSSLLMEFLERMFEEQQSEIWLLYNETNNSVLVGSTERH